MVYCDGCFAAYHTGCFWDWFGFSTVADGCFADSCCLDWFGFVVEEADWFCSEACRDYKALECMMLQHGQAKLPSEAFERLRSNINAYLVCESEAIECQRVSHKNQKGKMFSTCFGSPLEAGMATEMMRQAYGNEHPGDACREWVDAVLRAWEQRYVDAAEHGVDLGKDFSDDNHEYKQCGPGANVCAALSSLWRTSGAPSASGTCRERKSTCHAKMC